MIGFVTAVKLREWRGVKPVAGPFGVAITTRIRTTPGDGYVLDLVAQHVGKLRRADLAQVTEPQPVGSGGGQALGAPPPAQWAQEGVDGAVECSVGECDYRWQR
jgi:hypothetical protein